MTEDPLRRWLCTLGIDHRKNEIQQQLEIFSSERFEYPWKGVERLLNESPDQRIQMIGYGSLLNPLSAARTISDTPEAGHPPVIAWGAKRLFDYVIPSPILGQYVEPRAENQRAALNTIWTGKVENFLNGRAIELSLEDLPGLRERELDYDLMPVAWTPWDDCDSELRLGFVLCAKQNSRATSKLIKALPPYKQVCVEGAQLVGPEFESCFWDTTYQADGTTPEPNNAQIR